MDKPVTDAATARAELLAAGAEQQAALDELEALEAQVAAAQARRAELQDITAKRAVAIKQAKQRVEVAQQAEQAEASAVYVSEAAREWSDYYDSLGRQFQWWNREGYGIFDYQLHGAKFAAAAKRVIIGDEMGLGKSLTTIASLDLMEAKKIVVVCQADICDQFAGEFAQWAPHRNVVNLYKKSVKVRAGMLDDLWDMDEFVVIVNYELLRMSTKRTREVLTDLIEQQIDTVVLDEAHNIKDTTTSNFKHVIGLVFAANTCPRCKALVTTFEQPCPSCKWTKSEPTGHEYTTPLDMMIDRCSVKNMIMTTGTPILNDPGDLYPLLYLANPVQFPKKKSFYENYCQNNYFSGKWEFREGGLASLAPRIGGIYLARTTSDAGIVLPPQHIHIIPIDMDAEAYPAQLKVITDLTEAAEIVLSTGEAITVFDTMSLIMRKRQANVWPAGIEIHDKDTGGIIFSVGDECQESIKMDAMLEKVMEKHLEGKRQVVFSQFKSGLAELERRLTDMGIRAVRFDGDTPRKLRTEVKNNFYAKRGEEAKWDVILCNYKTGGTGLNLTSTQVTHILDEEWNPGKRNQAYARNHRMGQDQETEVYVYRINKSIDSWMAGTIKRKETIVQGFNEATEAASTTVTGKQLLEAMSNGEVL